MATTGYSERKEPIPVSVLLIVQLLYSLSNQRSKMPDCSITEMDMCEQLSNGKRWHEWQRGHSLWRRWGTWSGRSHWSTAAERNW